MKARPIIFSGPMVRAILAGTKTQTRRVISEKLKHKWFDEGNVTITRAAPLCPYGAPGDHLWVREACANGMGKPIYRADWDDPSDYERDHYPPHPDAAWLNEMQKSCGADVCSHEWKSPIHMPRWASRITLQIEGVRIERLNEISTDDIRSEGVDLTGLTTETGIRNAWVSLWNSINGPDAWDRNDWVWALTFRRITSEPKP